LTTTCPSPATGLGISTIFIFFGPSYNTAFMIFSLLFIVIFY
jgi:hypothetical protein